MHFSLIVPSVGRAEDLTRLLGSLAAQTCPDFEVIVVDQSGSGALDTVIAAFAGRLSLHHLRSAARGASRARNAGLALAGGDIVTWPDDDCFYPPDLLENVREQFQRHPERSVLVGNAVDEDGMPHNKRASKRPCRLHLLDLSHVGVEYALFIPRSVLTQVGAFSEEFGPGAGTLWWAGEATDLMMRLLRSELPLFYSPEIIIHHPSPNATLFSSETGAKNWHYAMGMGAAIRKNEGRNSKGDNRGIPRWFIVYYVFPYLRAAFWSLLRGKPSRFRTHWKRFHGVLNGWRSFDGLSGSNLSH